MRIALSLALPLALISLATNVQAAPIDSLPNFDGEESFESITGATPNVSYFAPAKLFLYSADLPLPSGVTLAYLGEYSTVVCNYAVGSPRTSLATNGEISSASDVAFGSSYALGNDGTVRIEFPQAVVAAGAYVTGNPGDIHVTAYDAANNVIETRTKAAVAVSEWKNNFAGIVDPAGTIRAIEMTASNGASAVDEVRFLTAFRPLSSSAPEPPGAHCANGGAAFGSGLDTNANGVLDASEVVGRVYACNGSDGTDGTNGSNGANALVSVTSEPAGAHCANGGQKIEAGVDTDNDGQLDASEVTATTYVCDGADGAPGASGADGASGANALISVTAEAAGPHCPNGGQKVEAGVDTDNDGQLDAGEVTATSYLCNGANGANGASGTNGTNGTNGADGASGPAGDSGCSAAPGAPAPWGLGVVLLALSLFRRRRAAVLTP